MAHQVGFKLKVPADGLEHFRCGTTYIDEVPTRHMVRVGDTVDWRSSSGVVGTAELVEVAQRGIRTFARFKFIS